MTTQRRLDAFVLLLASWASTLTAFSLPPFVRVRRDPLHLAFNVSTVPKEQQCLPAQQTGSAWTPANQSDDGGAKNLCIGGKLVPQLYLLGSRHMADPFIVQMVGAGAECAGFKKEYSFWGRQTLAKYPEHPDVVSSNWQETLPFCGKGERRRIAADFTTNYLTLVPRPHGTPEDLVTYRLPWVIASIYGSRDQRVQFVVMLRNPLSSLRANWKLRHQNEDFQQWAVAEMVAMSPSVWSNMYGFQMTLWTYLFSDSQFYVIPHRLFMGDASTQICEDLSKRLQFAMSCGPVPYRGPDDPPLGTEAEELRKSHAYSRTLLPDFADLIRVLQRGSAHGMGLAGYRGAAGADGAITSWLHRSW